MTDEDESTDPGIIAAEREILKFLGHREANEAIALHEGAREDRGTSTVNQSAQHLAPANLVKQTKTAEELAAMIHHDLSRLEGCPKQGVKVTVYGLNLIRILTAILATVLPRDKTILWASILSSVLLGERGS